MSQSVIAILRWIFGRGHTQGQFYQRQLDLGLAMHDFREQVGRNQLRIPGHHKVLVSPSSQSVKRVSLSSQPPVPSCRPPRVSFCLSPKYRGDNQ